MLVPLIDWTNKDNLVEEFRIAFTTVGFSRIYNLWDDDELAVINNWFRCVENWFLTATDKEVYAADSDAKQGWTGIEKQFLNPHKKNDWKENFELDTFDNLSYLPPKLQKSFEITFPIIRKFSNQLLGVFEQVIGVEKDFLLKAHANSNDHHFRLAYYPASTERVDQLPCGEHKDYNTLTLLFSPDANKRLQIKTLSGEWTDIEYLDNSVVINVGNILQIWTQDYLISAPHRVLFNEQASFTSAYFLNISQHQKLDKIGPNKQKYSFKDVNAFNRQFHKMKHIYNLKTKNKKLNNA